MNFSRAKRIVERPQAGHPPERVLHKVRRGEVLSSAVEQALLTGDLHDGVRLPSSQAQQDALSTIIDLTCIETRSYRTLVSINTTRLNVSLEHVDE